MPKKKSVNLRKEHKSKTGGLTKKGRDLSLIHI